MAELLPGILSQLGTENLHQLRKLAAGGMPPHAGVVEEDEDEDEVPDLVENFDEASKYEAAIGEDAKITEVDEEEDVKNPEAEVIMAEDAKIEETVTEP